MKTGYELYIQDSLTEEQHNRAIAFLEEFHNATQADPCKRYWGDEGGGYTSYVRRGTFGFWIDRGDLVFRRIAKNARRFAVVKMDTLKILTREDVRCPCPIHLGGAKVTWINKPAMTLWKRVGEPKG
jgi:hypothetical protein